MKQLVILLALAMLLMSITATAAVQETYFKFKVESPKALDELTKIVSIDKVLDGEVFAYANPRQWDNFTRLGYDYTILPNPSSLIVPKMGDTKEALSQWDTYPTYDAYVDWMYQFGTDYPDICRVIDAGTTVDGRNILFVKISDNPDTEEDEPEVMFTGTMHGDETTGYMGMLRLIDSILVSYGTDTRITNMVNEMEIWINPLANPDGTYAGGNSSVSSATRYNANSVDINRNFPDPDEGDHPDGNIWQPETVIMMNLAEAHSFVIAANFHGGAEVVNYPWDTWARLHADDQWYQDISRAYADTVHYYGSSSYMDDYNDGITNGYAWYRVTGGRQDYMNYWHGCREATIELSSSKMPSASTMPTYWNYNKRSYLDWLQNGLYGVRGIVTDASTSLPILATITTLDHDIDSARVFTDPDIGDYHRMLEAGTYDLEFSSTGYYTDTVLGVNVVDFQATVVNVALTPLPDDPVMVFENFEADAVNPGDDVSMSITLSNIGGGNATNMVGVLSTTDANITVTQNTSTYPTITALGGTGTSLTDYEFTIDAECPLYTQVQFALDLSDGGDYSDTLYFEFMIGDRVAFYFDDFSFDQGWSGLGGSAEWQIGSVSGGGGDPSEDHTDGSDNGVLGNDITSSGQYSNNISTTQWVTSPIIDCSQATGIILSYAHWLGVERSQYDHAYFEIYDGDDWVTLYENPNTSLSPDTWTEEEIDISAYADANPSFRIRFGLGSTDGSSTYCGWNIDDIELRGYTGSGGSSVLNLEPLALSDSLQPGDQTEETIKIKNTGTANLGVWFSSGDSWISLSYDKQTVSPGDSLDFSVLIDAGTMPGGDYTGSVDYTSNDPENASGSIPVSLHVFEADLAISETSIEQTVGIDAQETYPLVIDNNGPGRLIYSVACQMFDSKKSPSTTTLSAEPLGYRTVDSDKFPGQTEAYYAPVTTNSGGPDTYGHTWIDSDDPGGPTFSWIDITSLGTEITLTDDGYVDAIPIGFNFPMFDSTYSELCICANGLITFDTVYGSASNNTMPYSSLHSAVIAMWWDDLDPPEGNGQVLYYYDDVNGYFVVSFVDVRNYLYSEGTGSLNFQAILYPNGSIKLQYAVMDPGTDSEGLTGATIGIQNSAADDGLTMVHNASYMHDNLAIDISAASWLEVTPVSGQVEPYSNTTVNVNFDSEGMEHGSYTGQVTISCNDPDTPTKDIPVTMIVSEGCCVGETVGNMDGEPGIVDMGDLTRLIDLLFISLQPIECVEEGDVDLSGQPEPVGSDIDMGDLTVLIDHLFISLAPLPACP